MSTKLRKDEHTFAGRLRVLQFTTQPSKTRQAHADACDINNIVDRYHRTGQLPPTTRQPQYGDVTALQGDRTDLINQSRATLETAGSNLQKTREEQNKKQREKQNAEQIKNNSEQLRELIKTVLEEQKPAP